MTKLFVICIAGIFTFNFLIYSQSDKDSIRTYEMNEITVTGTKIETLRKYVPLTISVIPNDEIKKSHESEVLSLINDYVPGVFVTERGYQGYGLAQGGAGQISIRGLGSNPNTQVLILLDGRPQFMGLFGHPLPDNYITANVDRVEVVRGPASFLYGTNAMGGVINIITKRQKTDGFSVNVDESYGSFATLIGDAGVGYKKDKMDFYLSVSNQQTNGERPYSSFNLNNGFFRGGYNINKNVDVNVDANLTKFKTYDPGPLSTPLINNWVDIYRADAGLSINNNFSKYEGSLKLLYNYGEHYIYDGFHSKDRNVNLTAYESFKLLKNNVISLGLDYKNYGGEAEDQSTSYNFGKHFLDEFGAYIHLQQIFLKIFSFNGGVRYEHSNQFGGTIIPQAGIAYQILSNLSVRVNISKGFRSPTIRELYLFPAPTPNLEPERLWNYEFGLLYNIKDIFSIEPTVYLEKCQNIILTTGVYPNLTLSNSGSFTVKGFEISLKTKPFKYLVFNSGYSYIDAGEQTLGNPMHKFFINGSYTFSMFNLSISSDFVSKLYGDINHKERLPDYLLLNSSISANLIKEINFYISAENLLNKKYQIIFDYPMPGRTFSAGIKFNY